MRGTRLLFESKPLDDLGRCCSVEDQHFLTLKSELQENKGDVKKTVKLFQADPLCAIRDSSGKIHEIKSICREEIQSSDFKTARWLFETQPLDHINKGAGVQIIRGISLEEAQKGGVDKTKWMFETQPLDAIHEGAVEEQKFKGTVEDISGEAEVHNKLKLFENQPLSTLKGESVGEISEKEAIVGGNVGSTLWLFETQPMDTLKDSYEVGQLKKVVVSSEGEGEVKDKRLKFEKCSAGKTTSDSGNKVQDVEKGDVNTFKNLLKHYLLVTSLRKHKVISMILQLGMSKATVHCLKPCRCMQLKTVLEISTRLRLSVEKNAFKGTYRITNGCLRRNP